MNHHGIDLSGREVEELCKRNHIRKLSLFGSVLREDFEPASDVDVLVEFESGQSMGFLGMARLERELSALVGHKIDLRTAGELSRYFRDKVIKSAEVQYVAG